MSMRIWKKIQKVLLEVDAVKLIVKWRMHLLKKTKDRNRKLELGLKLMDYFMRRGTDFEKGAILKICGILYREREQFVDSIRCLESALMYFGHENNEAIECMNLLSEALYRIGKLPEAIETAKTAIAETAKMADGKRLYKPGIHALVDLWANLSFLYREAGQRENASVALDSAKEFLKEVGEEIPQRIFTLERSLL